MLEIIKRSTVCDRGGQGAQLQRRHGNAFAVAAHFSYATVLRSRSDSRECAEVLAFDVVPRHLAHAVLVRVLAHLGKTKPPPNAFKIRIIGMRDRLSQVEG